MSNVDWWARGIAMYGAGLSTALGIYQYWKGRVKVTVVAGFVRDLSSDHEREDGVVIKMTNTGGRVVTLKGIFTHRGKEVFAMTQHKHLPRKLEPTDEVSERYGTSLINAKTTRLGAYDTEGRTWLVSPKRLAELKKKAPVQ
jgi:hypothetical protein